MLERLTDVLYLVHDGQQLTEGKSESVQWVTVLKVQCETALKLGHQHTLSIGAPGFVSVRRKSLSIDDTISHSRGDRLAF